MLEPLVQFPVPHGSPRPKSFKWPQTKKQNNPKKMNERTAIFKVDIIISHVQSILAHLVAENSKKHRILSQDNGNLNSSNIFQPHILISDK